jgi:hypothetical protein
MSVLQASWGDPMCHEATLSRGTAFLTVENHLEVDEQVTLKMRR